MYHIDYGVWVPTLVYCDLGNETTVYDLIPIKKAGRGLT